MAGRYDERADSELSQSPTLTRQGTQVGVILGTAAYMSPEQAKGKRVDKRADVWAFGAVVYEMLTGKRALEGDDVSDTLAAVLRSEPDFDRLPRETPSALQRALVLCLTKDPKHRVHDIADVRLAIDGAFETETVSEAASSANFAVTDSGTLFYVAAGSASKAPLSWVDRTGKVERIDSMPADSYVWPRLSPEGNRVLVVVDGDAWVFDLASGRRTRLTEDHATNYLGWTLRGKK